MPWIIGGAVLGSAVIGGLAADKAADAQEGAASSANALQKYMYEQGRQDQAPYRQAGYGALDQLASLYGISTGNHEGSFDPGWYLRRYKDVAADPYYRNNPYQHWQDHGQKEGREFTGTTQHREDGVGTGFDAFYDSPDYRFALEEGNKALDRSAASRGRLFSGAQMKGLSRYNQGMASQQFNNYANRLASIAGIGQTATNQTNALGQNYATNAGNALQNAGAARASGYAGAANAVTGAINNGLYAYGMSGGFNSQPPPSNAYGNGYAAVGAFG